MNLLIVDDDPTSLKLLRTQLESEGHALFEAHDGVEALALLNRQRVDVVISDILMPRMDGYRLCHEIRMNERLRDLPIIIYTSTYTALEDEKLALEMGANKYLKKPASAATIVAALHEAIAAFRKFKINMTKIESRPSKRKAWEYFFFIDCDGHAQDKKVAGAIKILGKHCNFVKVLGSYPNTE